MEFESMDNCFPTAQDDSETTCNVPWTRGPMALTELNREPCGSSPRSTATVSTAATTAPFQNHRFDTISARYGLSLRKLLSSSVALPAVAATTGAIAWSGHLATIPLSLVAPLLVYRAKSRTHAYSMMFCYYAAASWPVIPGARAFFGLEGHSAHWLDSLCRGCSGLGVALGFVVHEHSWQSGRLCATVRPDRGDPAARDHRVGFTTAFRRRSFPGLEMAGARTHCYVSLSAFPRQAGSERRSVWRSARCFSRFRYTPPQLAVGWDAVNTNFGGAGQGDPDLETEYNTHQSIRRQLSRIPRSRAALPGALGPTLE